MNTRASLVRSVLQRLAIAFVALAGIAAQASTITFFHNDLAGSPVAATNSSGQVIWRESYRPYGERLTNSAAAASNDVWFTSRRQDADTGLVYMGARYYDPVIGRFISTDPKLFDEQNTQLFNRYTYANNNPYRYTDPDGKSPLAALARTEYALVFAAATRLGAASVGSAIGRGLYDWLHQEATDKPGTKEAQDAPQSQAGEVAKPEGIPDNWLEAPTRGEGGRQWVNPDNEGDRVRVMPGNPDSPNPSQRGPYVRDVRNGNQWLNTDGKRVEGKEGRNSPDTHIPVGDYVFVP